MIHFQVDRFASNSTISIKKARQALVNEAQAELAEARKEYRAARVVAGLPVLVNPAGTQRPSPTLPSAAGLPAKEIRQAVQRYDGEVALQTRRKREAAEMEKIFKKYGKGA